MNAMKVVLREELPNAENTPYLQDGRRSAK